ncbi:hypothetical protein V6N13_104945 [Hibiscus sabdariffa]
MLPCGNYSDENFEIIQEKIITDECLFRLSDVLEKIWEFIVTEKLKGTSPGRTLNCKFHVGTAKTLVLIVEKDEMERGHIGHPTSVLLEFLDLEQKINITDHYLDVPMDLAKVLFVGVDSRGWIQHVIYIQNFSLKSLGSKIFYAGDVERILRLIFNLVETGCYHTLKASYDLDRRVELTVLIYDQVSKILISDHGRFIQIRNKFMGNPNKYTNKRHILVLHIRNSKADPCSYCLMPPLSSKVWKWKSFL